MGYYRDLIEELEDELEDELDKVQKRIEDLEICEIVYSLNKLINIYEKEITDENI